VRAQYVVDPQLSGPAGGRVFFQGSKRTQLSVSGYRLIVLRKLGFAAVPQVERLIFDSLVSDFKKGTHDV